SHTPTTLLRLLPSTTHFRSAHLVFGEPAPARHDFLRGGLPDGFLHVDGVPGEKLLDGFVVLDHSSMRPCPLDKPQRPGVLAATARRKMGCRTTGVWAQRPTA